MFLLLSKDAKIKLKKNNTKKTTTERQKERTACPM
jgi:hypothetical protein